MDELKTYALLLTYILAGSFFPIGTPYLKQFFFSHQYSNFLQGFLRMK